MSKPNFFRSRLAPMAVPLEPVILGSRAAVFVWRLAPSTAAP